MLPEGADAVVMVEDTELISVKSGDDLFNHEGKQNIEHHIEKHGHESRQQQKADEEEDKVKILISVRSGENIREIGSDVMKGDLVLEKGTLISSAGGELGLLASIGITQVKLNFIYRSIY